MEDKLRDLKSMGDSVDLILKLLGYEEKTEEDLESISRNTNHLELMLDSYDWSAGEVSDIVHTVGIAREFLDE